MYIIWCAHYFCSSVLTEMKRPQRGDLISSAKFFFRTLVMVCQKKRNQPKSAFSVWSGIYLAFVLNS